MFRNWLFYFEPNTKNLQYYDVHKNKNFQIVDLEMDFNFTAGGRGITGEDGKIYYMCM